MSNRNWSTISAEGCVDEQKHSSLFLQHNKVFKMISNYKNILTLNIEYNILGFNVIFAEHDK